MDQSVALVEGQTHEMDDHDFLGKELRMVMVGWETGGRVFCHVLLQQCPEGRDSMVVDVKEAVDRICNSIGWKFLV